MLGAFSCDPRSLHFISFQVPANKWIKDVFWESLKPNSCLSFSPPPPFLLPHLPLHVHAVSTSDGQENAGKCPHLESEESDPSFGDLSNSEELKSPHKTDGPELEMPSLPCNGASAGALVSPEASKAKTDPEKKFICGICGQAFRTKSYLNKHQHRVHKAQKVQGVSGSSLSDIAPSLTSPFSPQQNMSLLESFGFQIVQSAFASSLVDAEVGQSGIDFGGKWPFLLEALQVAGKPLFLRTKLGCPQKILCIWEYLCLKTTFFFFLFLSCWLMCIQYFCERLPYNSYLFYFSRLCMCLAFCFIKKLREGFISFNR